MVGTSEHGVLCGSQCPHLQSGGDGFYHLCVTQHGYGRDECHARNCGDPDCDFLVLVVYGVDGGVEGISLDGFLLDVHGCWHWVVVVECDVVVGHVELWLTVLGGVVANVDRCDGHCGIVYQIGVWMGEV